jgi:hypothetical protein
MHHAVAMTAISATHRASARDPDIVKPAAPEGARRCRVVDITRIVTARDTGQARGELA